MSNLKIVTQCMSEKIEALKSEVNHLRKAREEWIELFKEEELAGKALKLELEQLKKEKV